ncbi:MAG: hypothetical protein FJX35_11480 [Alphaproteobacteria bacterium]|nr:hypothetical protein [Alphaproteobacteria bacterium]
MADDRGKIGAFGDRSDVAPPPEPRRASGSGGDGSPGGTAAAASQPAAGPSGARQAGPAICRISPADAVARWLAPPQSDTPRKVASAPSQGERGAMLVASTTLKPVDPEPGLQRRAAPGEHWNEYAAGRPERRLGEASGARAAIEASHDAGGSPAPDSSNLDVELARAAAWVRLRGDRQVDIVFSDPALKSLRANLDIQGGFVTGGVFYAGSETAAAVAQAAIVKLAGSGPRTTAERQTAEQTFKVIRQGANSGRHGTRRPEMDAADALD